MKMIHGVVVMTFMTFSFPLAISDGSSCYFSSKLANEQANISTWYVGILGKVWLFVLNIGDTYMINYGLHACGFNF